MSLANGIKQLSIPGPSVMPEAVLSAMHRSSPNIYGQELIDLANSLYPDLKRVARTRGDAVIYIGNGHAAWEASLTNTLSRGDKVLALITGLMALVAGVDAPVDDVGPVDAHEPPTPSIREHHQ